jgi:hypothetical protein
MELDAVQMKLKRGSTTGVNHASRDKVMTKWACDKY